MFLWFLIKQELTASTDGLSSYTRRYNYGIAMMVDVMQEHVGVIKSFTTVALYVFRA